MQLGNFMSLLVMDSQSYTSFFKFYICSSKKDLIMIKNLIYISFFTLSDENRATLITNQIFFLKIILSKIFKIIGISSF